MLPVIVLLLRYDKGIIVGDAINGVHYFSGSVSPVIKYWRPGLFSSSSRQACKRIYHGYLFSTEYITNHKRIRRQRSEDSKIKQIAQLKGAGSRKLQVRTFSLVESVRHTIPVASRPLALHAELG